MIDDEPMAAVYNIGSPDEQFYSGTTAEVLETVRKKDLKPPMLFIAGEAADALHMPQVGPLTELKVWLPDDGPHQYTLARELEKHGALAVVGLLEKPTAKTNVIVFRLPFTVTAFDHYENAGQLIANAIVFCENRDTADEVKKRFPEADIRNTEDNTCPGVTRALLLHTLNHALSSLDSTRINPVNTAIRTAS